MNYYVALVYTLDLGKLRFSGGETMGELLGKREEHKSILQFAAELKNIAEEIKRWKNDITWTLNP
ncbi:MAG: hypothetical protein CO103_04045 [Chloroflexi bacterium CG_4_9_14_3_um_filter_45_9]|nr:MAG: hypothetical protein CO103_04045 [Chloroflexi bacterium CG_4_9_14_3_um_filter_45_9]